MSMYVTMWNQCDKQTLSSMLVHCSLHTVLSKDRDTAANCCLSDRISYVDQMLSSIWKNGAKEKI